MLEDLKIMLDFKSTEINDPVLELMLRDAVAAVTGYCHLKELPPALEWVVRELVINKVLEENEGNVSSVKRGDTQINYAAPISTSNFTQLHVSTLNTFRKLKIG